MVLLEPACWASPANVAVRVYVPGAGAAPRVQVATPLASVVAPQLKGVAAAMLAPLRPRLNERPAPPIWLTGDCEMSLSEAFASSECPVTPLVGVWSTLMNVLWRPAAQVTRVVLDVNVWLPTTVLAVMASVESLHRMTREERDLDGALLLLVSDAGRFIAGTTIVVDGGQMVALRG